MKHGFEPYVAQTYFFVQFDIKRDHDVTENHYLFGSQAIPVTS